MALCASIKVILPYVMGTVLLSLLFSLESFWFSVTRSPEVITEIKQFEAPQISLFFYIWEFFSIVSQMFERLLLISHILKFLKYFYSGFLTVVLWYRWFLFCNFWHGSSLFLPTVEGKWKPESWHEINLTLNMKCNWRLLVCSQLPRAKIITEKSVLIAIQFCQ